MLRAGALGLAMARRVLGAVSHCAHVRSARYGYGAIGVALGAGKHSADQQTYQNDDAALHLARKITQAEHKRRYRAGAIPVEFAEETNDADVSRLDGCARVGLAYFTIAPMRGLSFTKGIAAALRADTASLVAFEIGLFAWMAISRFVIFAAEIHPTSPVHWFMMQIGMILGLFTAYPVNKWLLLKGWKGDGSRAACCRLPSSRTFGTRLMNMSRRARRPDDALAV